MLLLTDYNVKIDGGNFYDQPVKSNIRAYENIEQIVTAQDDYTASYLLGYPHFKEN